MVLWRRNSRSTFLASESAFLFLSFIAKDGGDRLRTSSFTSASFRNDGRVAGVALDSKMVAV